MITWAMAYVYVNAPNSITSWIFVVSIVVDVFIVALATTPRPVKEKGDGK